MNPIRTERLILRQWQDRDRSLFHRINSDDRVMEFFPARRTREQSDELLDILREEIDRNGFGFAAIEFQATGECIGFAGLHEDSVMSSWPAGTIEIGWRLAPNTGARAT
jgi:RimJ/RimL family protein N-acetyltransferase